MIASLQLFSLVYRKDKGQLSVIIYFVDIREKMAPILDSQLILTKKLPS